MRRFLLLLAFALPACDGCRSDAVVEPEAPKLLRPMSIDGGRRRFLPGSEHRPQDIRFRLKRPGPPPDPAVN